MRAREEHAPLIAAYNAVAEAAGRPQWSDDEEYSCFSNHDNATQWGVGRTSPLGHCTAPHASIQNTRSRDCPDWRRGACA